MTKLNCILLVDDDSDCNYYHQRMLTKMECADLVKIVNDGRQAIEFLSTKINGKYPMPEIIFLDINMPKMNGWEFLNEYKKLDETAKAKIILIMLTTSLNPDDKERAAQYSEIKGYKNKYLNKETITRILSDYFADNQ